MFLSGYLIAFVVGVAVGFVFSTIILFGGHLEQESSERLNLE